MRMSILFEGGFSETEGNGFGPFWFEGCFLFFFLGIGTLGFLFLI